MATIFFLKPDIFISPLLFSSSSSIFFFPKTSSPPSASPSELSTVSLLSSHRRRSSHLAANGQAVRRRCQLFLYAVSIQKPTQIPSLLLASSSPDLLSSTASITATTTHPQSTELALPLLSTASCRRLHLQLPHSPPTAAPSFPLSDWRSFFLVPSAGVPLFTASPVFSLLSGAAADPALSRASSSLENSPAVPPKPSLSPPTGPSFLGQLTTPCTSADPASSIAHKSGSLTGFPLHRPHGRVGLSSHPVAGVPPSTPPACSPSPAHVRAPSAQSSSPTTYPQAALLLHCSPTTVPPQIHAASSPQLRRFSSPSEPLSVSLLLSAVLLLNHVTTAPPPHGRAAPLHLLRIRGHRRSKFLLT